MNVLDLFCGCGGLSYGFHNNGYNILAAYDFWKDAVSTYNNNYNGIAINSDISKESFLKYKDKVDILIGGPPCQPFSVVGKQKGSSDLRDMIPEFIRAVKEVRPKVFIMENVTGLLSKRNTGYFNAIIKNMSNLGYELTYEVLDFRNWGVPQKRKRLIIIGSSLTKDTTLGLAIRKIPMIKPTVTEFVKLKDLFPISNIGKKSGNFVYYCKNPVVASKMSSSYLVNGKGRPLDIEGQSGTITASGGNSVHFWDPNSHFYSYHKHLRNSGKVFSGRCKSPSVRRLAFNELKVIQTFPDNYIFFGSASSQIKQLGNAVPPLFSFELAKYLKKYLE